MSFKLKGTKPRLKTWSFCYDGPDLVWKQGSELQKSFLSSFYLHLVWKNHEIIFGLKIVQVF